ncbi:LacI family DNA-binding transcriptional regulator [Carnobacterium sp. TMP28]|uniref:LacI family DNA-binding transcriptional regulator n=1 Tax=Carnobacterium sp. TMP28 TaxID=3397060 RepID=UPI0039E1E6B2
MAITIKDVAKKAGVATSTVSRTIQNHSSISEKTKKKVRSVMEELGYQPNLAARGLVSKNMRTIGVILPVSDGTVFKNPFFLEMIRGISKACNENNYMVALASGTTQEELLESIQIMAKGGRADGFIVLYSKKKDKIIEYLHQEKLFYAMIGKPYEYENEIVYVDNDNKLAGRDATDYLLALKHKKIAYINKHADQMMSAERLVGYKEALLLKGIEVNPTYILEEKMASPNQKEKIKELFISEQHPTAVVAGDDLIAMELIYLLKEFNLRIPEDVSIISFNNSVFAEIVQPPLTSIDLHVAYLSEQVVEKLIDLIEGKQNLAIKVILPHEIIERKSCKLNEFIY